MLVKRIFGGENNPREVCRANVFAGCAADIHPPATLCPPTPHFQAVTSSGGPRSAVEKSRLMGKIAKVTRKVPATFVVCRGTFRNRETPLSSETNFQRSSPARALHNPFAVRGGPHKFRSRPGDAAATSSIPKNSYKYRRMFDQITCDNLRRSFVPGKKINIGSAESKRRLGDFVGGTFSRWF